MWCKGVVSARRSDPTDFATVALYLRLGFVAQTQDCFFTGVFDCSTMCFGKALPLVVSFMLD